MKKFTIGMIGFGYWGKILFRYFKKHEGFNIKRIATRHPQKLKEEIREDIIFCKPGELLDDNEIEAVIISTPIGTHYPYIMEALNRGMQVFCEKPLTVDSHKAREVSRLAREKNLNVFTDYIFTYSPAVLKMISLVNEGAVGEVTSAVFHVRQLGHFSANSVVTDLGCHILSVLDLLEPINNFKFSRMDLLSHDEVVETSMVNFEPRGEKTTLNGGIFLSFNHPVKVRNMTIYGNKGTVVYDMMEKHPLQLLHYKTDRENTRDPRDKNIQYFEFDEFNTVERVVEGFYYVLTGKVKCNLDMAVRVTEVLEKLEDSN